MKKTNKVFSVFLALLILVSSISVLGITASAMTSGVFGDNLTWVYNSSTYTLTISGEGAMDDYDSLSDNLNRPWENYVNSLKIIVINAGVTSIGECAFKDCTRLTSITIPNSITSINYAAFEDCTSLTNVTIPAGVAKIGYSAFGNCTNLKNVIIGNGVKEISSSSFNNTAYYNDMKKWENGVLYIDKYLIKARTSVTGDYTIKEGTVAIAADAFENCSNLTGVTIPSGVKSIGDYAFLSCTKLKNITIPDSVTSIGNYPFFDTAYYYETKNWENNVLYVGNYLINAKTSIKSNYKVKDGTLAIAGSAFFDCSTLTSVTIPDSVISIGYDAFGYCKNIKSVYISDVSAWCNIDFYDSYSNPLRYGAILYLNSEKITDLSVPSGVTHIKKYAFYNCDSISNVTVPDSVTIIDASAFAGCDGLTKMVVDSNNENYSSDGFGVLFNKNKTKVIRYPAGNTRTSYTIPDSATSIDKYAFDCCTSLKNITIPNGVVFIGNYAFRGCKGLTKIIIPDGINSIKEFTFSGCTSLASVTIPNNVTSIGRYAFENCTSLTNVIIGNGMKTICKFAFDGCNKIIDVCYSGTEKQWNEIYVDTTNDEITGANIVFNYHVHSYKSVIISATCNQNGYIREVCECGDFYVSKTIDSVGHYFVNEYCVYCGKEFSPNDTYDYNYKFLIQTPSRNEIRNKDGIILHVKVEGNAPAISYVRWESSNSNFDESADGTKLKIFAKNKGWTTFTAILCDVDGNELARYSIDMYSKSGFFDKIGGFFRSLFGTTKIYDN